MSEVTREALADAIAKDAKAAPAFAALPTAHRAIVSGACATIAKASKTGDAAAIASAKRSICGGPHEQPKIDAVTGLQELAEIPNPKAGEPGEPDKIEAGAPLVETVQAPALAGGADIWAAIEATAGL